VRLQEWLNFITSELHTNLARLFNASLPEETKVIFRDKLFKRFDFLQITLSSTAYVAGDSFSIADAYLFTVLNWCKFFAIDLSGWPALSSYMTQISLRPAVQVQAALHAEAMQ